MTTYVIRNGELVNKNEAEPLIEKDAAPHYISDHMDPLFHHAALRKIDSKSEFRRETRNHGCREIGDQTGYGKREFVPKLDKHQRKDDIRKAIYDLRNGRR